MDPDILQIADAQPELPARKGASSDVLARARAASAASRKKKKEGPTPDADSLRMATRCVPGCAGLLGDQLASRDQRKLPLEAMIRLAVSPKIRGSGPVVEKVRKL